MTETASSWTLTEGAGYRRESPRPTHLRQANFEELFDAKTIFYDCFRLSSTRVMLIGPPLKRFPGVLGALAMISLPSGMVCSYRVEHKFATAFPNRHTDTICRITADVLASDFALQLQSEAGDQVLQIRPNAGETFRDRRVLLTLSKNNDPVWICDWMRFHRDLQGADAVLLYDNGSTAYSAASLLETMRRVEGFQAISVVEWPFKYGPQGVGRGTWDSSFCQDGALEDARWRFLGDARAVLNCDVDELVVSEREKIFDMAADSKASFLRFAGRWVDVLETGASRTTPRHRESSHRLLPQLRWKTYCLKDINRCPTKWAVVPRRCPPEAQWSVHEIIGMRAGRLTMNRLGYRHFRQISTNWKSKRKETAPRDTRLYKQDIELVQAFDQVRWDR